MTQGKLKVVKQEMARVSINILGISELKWTRMGEFNSDDHYIYYCGQDSLRRSRVALLVNKRVWNAVLGCSLKNDRMISVRSKGKPFSITVSQIYAPTLILRSWIWMVLWRWPVRTSRTNTKKKVPFIIGDWNAKVGSQEIPGVTGKFGLGVQNEIGQKLTEFCQEHTGHSEHPLPTTQEKTLHMDITRWSIPKSDWLYPLQSEMEKLYTVSKIKTGSWLWLRSWTPYCQMQT